jgi:hypothetical protein
MPSEPSPEELRRRLEQSFERWRQRLDNSPPADEQPDDEPDETVEDS